MTHETDPFGRNDGVGPLRRRHYGAPAATGNTDDAVWKQLMDEWYGLKPVRGDNWLLWAACPHRLIGKRCRCGGLPWQTTYSDVWDHARAWRNGDGTLVITLEPWGNPFDQTAQFVDLERDLTELGITTAFEGRSPYGASYILFLIAADSPWGRVFERTPGRAARRLTTG
ncbi:hypothetical protein [Tsukamurella paurometabola]|uniref:Uncharacterized protein n=1 Tax=Tsukamurella paurometabola TaxID=2061 RepID=A0ABS5NIN4_TSUPA|nr:hypothetical protein [Tsukamurella paurometabola]MBS4103885.1 hypothetical protein [Tsukamurella paurometabola]